MDKKMKRVVGYVAPKVEKKESVIKAQKMEDVLAEPVKSQINVSEIIASEIEKAPKIVKWINDHPAFKWGVMCSELGIDRGNFQRTLNSEKIKIKIEFIAPIEEYLKKYGYVQ